MSTECKNYNCPFNNDGACSPAHTIETEIGYQSKPKLFGIIQGVSVPEAQKRQAKSLYERMEKIRNANCRNKDYPLKNALNKLKSTI